MMMDHFRVRGTLLRGEQVSLSYERGSSLDQRRKRDIRDLARAAGLFPDFAHPDYQQRTEARTDMRVIAILAALLALSPLAGHAAEGNLAATEPDRLAWQLFAELTAPAPGHADKLVFESWASNDDTFRAEPKYPVTPSPKVLHFPALGGRMPTASDGPWRRGAPGGEEVRRNKATFDYITAPQNRFHTREGLARAFAAKREIKLPVDSIEVKANWIAVEEVDRARYYVSVASDGKEYALVALHITTKLIPNWTWATFEHVDNNGRCDVTGCRDSFGATVPVVAAQAKPGGRYPACEKTPAVAAMMRRAKLAGVLSNYCLKGTQSDFVTATGLPTLLGNSVTEFGFADTSSCISCHARASVDAAGAPAQGFGFMQPPDRTTENCPSAGRCSPNGTPDPGWFWDNPGASDAELKALQTDFLFSITLHAIGTSMTP